MVNIKFNGPSKFDVIKKIKAVKVKRMIRFITVIECPLIVNLFFAHFTVENSFVEKWRKSQRYRLTIKSVFDRAWQKYSKYTNMYVTASFTPIYQATCNWNPTYATHWFGEWTLNKSVLVRYMFNPVG